MKAEKPYILMLEDDDDDRYITTTYFAANNFDYEVKFLTNSDDVMPFLEPCVSGTKSFPRLIILDKNVPAAGGIDVLRSIKSHPVLRVIPVVMISGSAFPAEVTEAYRLGVNSFIVKPASSELTEKKIQNFLTYWFNSVELPELPAITVLPNA